MAAQQWRPRAAADEPRSRALGSACLWLLTCLRAWAGRARRTASGVRWPEAVGLVLSPLVLIFLDLANEAPQFCGDSLLVVVVVVAFQVPSAVPSVTVYS